MKPGLLLALSAAPLLSLAACRGPEPAPPPPIDIAKSDASPAEPASSSVPAAKDAAATGAAPPALNEPEPPPAGMYAITMVDRSNSCADAGAPSWSNQPLLVPTKPATDGRWVANLPINTGVGSPGIDRHDVLLEVGQVAKSSIRPDRTCAWEVSREIEIREVSPAKIVANIRTEWTDAVRCTLPRKPVSCTRDVDITYTLVRALCPPRCLAQPGPVARDGGVDAKCVCPDAGAP